MTRFILALDQGTSSTRAILFDERGAIHAKSQREVPLYYPQPGWVNQDAEELWESTLAVAREAVASASIHTDQIAAIGITNQRETTILWDRATGKPVSPAIVWQSRQSAGVVEDIVNRGKAGDYQRITGLVPDAYFSATKIAWLLDHDPDLRRRAEAGEIAFGTVDSWLLWRLSGGAVHLTDYANASRTMLFDIRRLDWSQELLSDLGIPSALLPRAVASAGLFCETLPAWFGVPIPVTGVAGDQQAALFGQVCLAPGEAKNTYGTGSFLLMNTGEEAVPSRHRLLTTIAWGLDGTVQYALEGAIFVTGAAVQWLRDGLGIVARAQDIEALAASVPDSGGVVFVPALTGLGAPHWDPNARGTIIGITRGTTAAHIARATLESIAFQTRDVLDAMMADSGVRLAELRVDGGAAVNDLLLQIQADALGVPVVRPVVTETTALGAAYLAGLASGLWKTPEELRALWRIDRRFEPRGSESSRNSAYARWCEAVDRARGWARPGE